ncbi:MAG: rRNA maturation RNase YbeY [Lachnospiraceae bacterium]
MAIYIEEEVVCELAFDVKEIASMVIDYIADIQGIPYEFDVNLTIVDNETIHQINKEYREMDRPTDVLSFPNVDFETPSDFSVLEDEAREMDYFDMETGILLLGDIVLSIDKVKEQAIEYGHSIKREFAFLIAHSMLHLCGYDHMTGEEASVMELEQTKAMEALKITREEQDV